MRVLILGGTIFLGRHILDAALAAEHEVTIFNRGRHHARLPLAVERLYGDRDGNLSALAGRQWDAVIDTCGYVPRIVRAAARQLADAAPHYAFISTISVYRNLAVAGIDESAPVAALEDAATEEITGHTYGPLKAACERVVAEAYPTGALCIRPGLIVGPHDPTDRFTYWPSRVARGGRVLAPGHPEREVQFIDVRDLAEWIVRMVERRRTGTFNATGPTRPLTMLGLLEACRAACGSDATFVWLEDEFLTEQGVHPYTEAPLWVPGTHDTVDCSRATGEGLILRLLEETIQDTLTWDRSRPAAAARNAGFRPEREEELLSAWSAVCR
jgi:2'-hydroxyisoflavone reductase